MRRFILLNVLRWESWVTICSASHLACQTASRRRSIRSNSRWDCSRFSASLAWISARLAATDAAWVDSASRLNWLSVDVTIPNSRRCEFLRRVSASGLEVEAVVVVVVVRSFLLAGCCCDDDSRRCVVWPADRGGEGESLDLDTGSTTATAAEAGFKAEEDGRASASS